MQPEQIPNESMRSSRRREEVDSNSDMSNPPPHVGGYEEDEQIIEPVEFTFGLKRRALFPGSEKRTRDRLSLLAKIVGSQSAKAIASRMHNGRTPDRSAPTTGNTSSGTTGQSLI